MTKAECIFKLKQIQGVYAGMRKEYLSCVEALGMAINALEQTAWIPCSERLQHALDGKTEEETYDFLYWLMYKYAKQYTDSRSAVIEWLREGGAKMEYNT